MKKSLFTQFTQILVIVFAVSSFSCVYAMKDSASEKVPTQAEAPAPVQTTAQAQAQRPNRVSVRLEALRHEMEQILEEDVDQDSDEEDPEIQEIRAEILRSLADEEAQLVMASNQTITHAPRTNTRTLRRVAPAFELPPRLQNLNNESNLIESPRASTSPSTGRSPSPVERLRDFRARSPQTQLQEEEEEKSPDPINIPSNIKYDCD